VAVVVNVTATEASGAGFVSVVPTGAPVDASSILNVEHAGQTIQATSGKQAGSSEVSAQVGDVPVSLPAELAVGPRDTAGDPGGPPWRLIGSLASWPHAGDAELTGAVS
jgi:hypothetical protein